MQTPDSYTRFLIRLYWWTVVLLTIASVVTAKGQEVLFINGNHSAFQDNLFKLVTHLGEGWIFILVLLISIFTRYSLSLSIALMAVLNGIICAIIKQLFFSGHFPRPSAVLDHRLLYFVPGVVVHSQNSFPSGHTATIFCFAVLFSVLVRSKRASAIMLAVALSVGYSRIYLLQHFLMDVTAGALIGVASAFTILYLFDRIQLPPWTSRKLLFGNKRFQ